ncbi:hypothetical protein EJ08DRAFT_152625 [Tothia fuscella]|uniref:Uncharacterized protein n=1 Tax=Tothia fuscella TaxID=1048955 RepID=A0A9P4P468_9PEZI|nr:hypothetical protein EJ08DRAFT_152625 [Tothia fuscella]
MVKLFPSPWEGAHPIFPKQPEPSTCQPFLDRPAVVGLCVGLPLGLSRYLLKRSYPGCVLNAIGSSTAFFATYFAMLQVARIQREPLDIHPIFEQDSLQVPRRRFYETTKAWTEDDYLIIGAIAGLSLGFRALSLRSYRLSLLAPKFGTRRALGGACLGTNMAGAAFLIKNQTAVREREAALPLFQQAQQEYARRMGRPPPAYAYDYASVFGLRNRGEEISFRIGSLIVDEKPSANGALHSVLPFGPDPDQAHEPEPPGSHPHLCAVVNGELRFLSTRDYQWRPSSTSEGVDVLQSHISTLSKRRAHLTHQATYLWYEIAEREKQFATRPADDEAEEWIKKRKALELLCSLHSNLWTEISEADWLIADSKKMLLQLQSNGTWVPEREPGSADPKTYVPSSILEKLRKHKESTGTMLYQLENAVIPPTTPDAEKLSEVLAENMEQLRGNDASTSELIEELERRGPRSD